MRWILRLSTAQHRTVSLAVRQAQESLAQSAIDASDRSTIDVLDVIWGRLRHGTEIEVSMREMEAVRVALLLWLVTARSLQRRNSDSWQWAQTAADKLERLVDRYKSGDLVTRIGRLDGVPEFTDVLL